MKVSHKYFTNRKLLLEITKSYKKVTKSYSKLLLNRREKTTAQTQKTHEKHRCIGKSRVALCFERG